ncbi:RNA polymerase sigma factor WhiG [Leptospira bourretii]|uniref:RNA polymerase sigma factor n=7 Tax=Leptospira TaxID=171 RepID=A0A4R9IPE5_9LEPT|nr:MULTISPECIES: RNA polymerase sigma factor WhiG [Leptospira]PKA27562.1 RNA polymerase sigma factor WhiG [Leptospira sp. mixed culture ATI2-C-A1]EKJ86657.1 RNA polymerase sigma factor WhiG [Leptospira meyeri serovar Hardjo str. Went 5]EMJ85852.1 RNA polymerase sigma factor WhiG [Leptospira meyeri serovar Semaranga str. Veldrot Semarang 173]MBM9590087.1 RNA polymerase sigma factor WhiG [Leptospira chreensis]MCG6139665.1 RNA polymerase sigma factor WhiG [Leptospira mtsangambouensis]
MSRLLDKYNQFDETDLWKKYRVTKDAEIRSYLVEKYSPLVKHVAGRIAIGMPQNVEFEDLVSYGVFGLLDAIEKFDPSREIKFKTYAMTRIRGSIFDELRSVDWIPRSIRQKAKQLENIIAMLENKEGKKVDDEEIAKELGVSMEEYNSLLAKLSGTSLVSLNDIWFLGDENDEVSFMETLESPMNMNPDNIIEKEEIKNVIVEAIQSLPEKEKKVIVLYYYEDLTLKEIGEVLEVTESRISQLHTKAVARLRSKLSKVKSAIQKR